MAEWHASLEHQRTATLKTVWLARLSCVLLLPLAFLPFVVLAFSTMTEQLSGATASLALRLALLVQSNTNLYVTFALAWAGVSFWLLGRHFRNNGLQPAWDYVSDYKRVAFSKLCEQHFPALQYRPEGYIGYDEFDAMRLFEFTSDWYLSEDFFGGRHGSTDLHFAEVHAKRERTRLKDGSLKKYDETFFHGLVFVADFHKHFHCTARLIPACEKLPKIRDQELVTLEDPDFQDRFQITTSDQTDIRYLLSTSMMQRFLQLSRRYEGLRAMFKNDQLTLVLPDARNHFEPSLYRPAGSSSQFKGFVRDVRSVLEIIDELDLNTRIWSRA